MTCNTVIWAFSKIGNMPWAARPSKTVGGTAPLSQINTCESGTSIFLEGPKRRSRLPPMSISLQPAARGHGPDHLDLVVVDAVDPVEHIADDAAVVGQDGDALADLRPASANREVDKAMFF